MNFDEAGFVSLNTSRGIRCLLREAWCASMARRLREHPSLRYIVRLHMDPCTESDGPLKVVPGSHRNGVLTPSAASIVRDATGEIVCEVGQGGAMVMRPLLLHASSKSRGGGRRRVLQFLFGPASLPHGLRW